MSSTRAGLIVSSVKTYRGTQKASSTPWSAHWNGWVSTLRSDYSARKKLWAATAGSDSSSWQTARVSTGGWTQDKGDPNAKRLSLQGEAEAWRSPTAWDGRRGVMADPDPKAGQHSLNNQASLWQTPGTDSFRSRGGDRKDEMGLDQQVRAFSAWPTVTTNDAKRGSDSNRPNRRNEGEPLSEASAKWATPAANLYNESESLESWERRAAGLKARGINGNGLGMPLGMQARLWGTPSAHDGRRPGADLKSTQRQNLSRDTVLWPTPAARDHKGTNSQLHVEETGTGRMHMDQLPNFAAYGFPHLPPGPPTSAGPTSSRPALDFYLRLRATTDSRLRSEMRSLLRMKIRARGKTWRERAGWTRRTSDRFVRPSFRRQLNPTFAEWLMGCPGPGWTGFEPLATVYSPLARPLPGSSCQPSWTESELLERAPGRDAWVDFMRLLLSDLVHRDTGPQGSLF